MKNAIIKNGEIVGTVILEPGATWSPPEGCTVMLLSEALAAQIPYADDPPPTAEELRAQVIRNGFLVEPEGCYLALEERDVIAFTQLAALLPIQLSQGSITALTLHKVKDKNDHVHQFTTARMLEILGAYGAYVKSLWDAALPS